MLKHFKSLILERFVNPHLWITRNATPMLNGKLSTCLTRLLHYRLEPFKGLTKRLKGVAFGVAIVLVGALCLGESYTVEAQEMPTTLKTIADYQLTDKQYKCHNEIVYRESRWKADAVGNINGTKQVHGYYQLKTEAAKGLDDYAAFYMYWRYVAKRYGITQYDEPDYCKALHHLKTRGWQ